MSQLILTTLKSDSQTVNSQQMLPAINIIITITVFKFLKTDINLAFQLPPATLSKSQILGIPHTCFTQFHFTSALT